MRWDLDEWVRSQLRVLDITALRERPWADVWRVTAADGVWWLKVNSRLTAYETRLLDLFESLRLELVPESTSHPREPWALIRDAGASGRDRLRGAPASRVVAFWADLLPRYAELQQSIAAEDLIGIGVPDLSPGLLVAHYDRLLSDSQWFRSVIAPEFSSTVHQRVLSARTELVELAGELASGIAPTVQHDDLHDGNVFVSAAGPRIIDWGDAVLAHPFSSLRVTLNVLSAQLRVELDDPVLRPVRDAYLEAWLVRGESWTELRRQLEVALRVAGLGRALGWARALGTPTAGAALDFADAVAGWMGQLADDVLGPAGHGDL